MKEYNMTLSVLLTSAFSCCVFNLTVPSYKFAMDQCSKEKNKNRAFI